MEIQSRMVMILISKKFFKSHFEFMIFGQEPDTQGAIKSDLGANLNFKFQITAKNLNFCNCQFKYNPIYYRSQAQLRWAKRWFGQLPLVITVSLQPLLAVLWGWLLGLPLILILLQSINHISKHNFNFSRLPRFNQISHC